MIQHSGSFFSPQDSSVTVTVCSIWFKIRNAITVIEVFVTYFSCVFLVFKQNCNSRDILSFLAVELAHSQSTRKPERLCAPCSSEAAKMRVRTLIRRSYRCAKVSRE